MADFFSQLSYSYGNEDWETEQKALKLKPKDHVLCITASGDRPLHLLLKDCEKIVSLDANPIQNHLLSLKMTAMKQLNFDEYLAFLGATPSINRKECFQTLSKDLHPETAKFWHKQEKKILKGVLYEGSVERKLRRAMPFINRLSNNKLKHLFKFNDLKDQQAFIQKEWSTWYWRKAFDIALSRPSARYLVRDPGLYAHVDPSFKAGSYVFERLRSGLMRNLAKDNIFASLIFNGSVGKEASPPYLKKEGFETIKPRLEKITTHTQELVSYLENAPDNSFDAFSLSDVSSYISKENFVRLTHAVYRTAKPGARFCMREFLSQHQIPNNLKSFYKRDIDLEKKLETEDRCLVYRFIAGHIEK